MLDLAITEYNKDEGFKDFIILDSGLDVENEELVLLVLTSNAVMLILPALPKTDFMLVTCS